MTPRTGWRLAFRFEGIHACYVEVFRDNEVNLINRHELNYSNEAFSDRSRSAITVDMRAPSGKRPIDQRLVCSNCFEDAFLGDWISCAGTIHTCDYCIQRNIKCVTMAELAERVEETVSQNFRVSHDFIDRLFELDDPGLRGSVDDVIGQMVDAKTEAVVEDLVWLLGKREEYEVVKEGAIPSFDDSAFLIEKPVGESFGFLTWEFFCSELLKRRRFMSKHSTSSLDLMFSNISGNRGGKLGMIHTITTSSNNRILYRARIAKTQEDVNRIRENPARELGAPPSDKAVAGRMNSWGIPVFYGATTRKLCIAEVKPMVGEVVVSGKFEITRKLRAIDFTRPPRAKERFSFFDENYFEKMGQFRFLSSFGKEISKPTQPQYQERDYLPTQALTEYLAEVHNIDAVFYSSSQSFGRGRNVAILAHACGVETQAEGTPPSYEPRLHHFKVPLQEEFLNHPPENSLRYVANSLKIHAVKSLDYHIDEVYFGFD